MTEINVLTCSDVEFSRLSWWSNWIDICVFNYASCAYLLQMRISRTNAKKFTTRALGDLSAHASVSLIENLIQMPSKNSNKGLKMADYDEEFGPNVIDRCCNCSSALSVDEICWCTNKGDNDE